MPAAPRIRLALAVICLGSLVAPLDTTVNTAFPVITGAFGLALRDIQWVVIPFVLAQTSLALVFGHLGDRIGHRRVFAAGMAACVLGHLAVALAPDFPLLVAGRVLQGMAVVEVDERWSTTEAQAQAGVRPRGVADAGLDARAAAVILEQYLQSGVADAAA